MEAGLRGETQPLTTPSLSTAFATAQTQKGFWDYFSQSSGDKSKVARVQQQKLTWETT